MEPSRNNKRETLARIAETLARKPLRGDRDQAGVDLAPILDHFVRTNPRIGFDWCAAFVYHCCVEAGFDIPAQPPKPVRRSMAGVSAWLQWAKLPENRCCYSAKNHAFTPQRGDLVVFDDLLGNGPHDHIGVVLAAQEHELTTAEGNVDNASGIFTRRRGQTVRDYIRIPNR